MAHPKADEIARLFEKPERFLLWLGSKLMTGKIEDALPDEERTRPLNDALLLFVREHVDVPRYDRPHYIGVWNWAFGPIEARDCDQTCAPLPRWIDPLDDAISAMKDQPTLWYQLHRATSGYIDRINSEVEPAPS